MTSFVTRICCPEDIEQIGKLDETLKSLVLYHGDFQKENMVCAATADGRLLACGLLMPTEWFSAVSMEKSPDFVHYINFDLYFAEGFRQKQIADALVERLIQRGYEIKAQYPHKRIAVAQYMDMNDPKRINYYLGHGFCFFDSAVEFRFDLGREIPDFPKPDGITVRRGILCDPVSLEQYHMAEIEAFDGISWSISQTKWMQNAPELCNFSAYYGDEFVGNTSTWTVAPEQGVTENVFVVPKW